jgi:long-chain acyl-CoA synthetase
MVKLISAATDYAKELQPPPEVGKPYSIPLPGSAKPGRTAVYRNWRFTDGLMETLDPKIRTCHEFFEETGK